MGMMDSAYWMSWHVYHLVISFVSSLLLCAPYSLTPVPCAPCTLHPFTSLSASSPACS